MGRDDEKDPELSPELAKSVGQRIDLQKACQPLAEELVSSLQGSAGLDGVIELAAERVTTFFRGRGDAVTYEKALAVCDKLAARAVANAITNMVLDADPKHGLNANMDYNGSAVADDNDVVEVTAIVRLPTDGDSGENDFDIDLNFHLNVAESKGFHRVSTEKDIPTLESVGA